MPLKHKPSLTACFNIYNYLISAHLSKLGAQKGKVVGQGKWRWRTNKDGTPNSQCDGNDGARARARVNSCLGALTFNYRQKDQQDKQRQRRWQRGVHVLGLFVSRGSRVEWLPRPGCTFCSWSWSSARSVASFHSGRWCG